MTALRTRIFYTEKFALTPAICPHVRRFVSPESRRKMPVGDVARRFSRILSVSIFRRGLWPTMGPRRAEDGDPIYGQQTCGHTRRSGSLSRESKSRKFRFTFPSRLT